VIVETDHKRSDEIESLAEIGQTSKRVNSPDNATDSKQPGDFSKHRDILHIEASSFMAEQLCDMQKISGATAKIENALGPRQIELDLANAANVDADPAVKIEIFWPIADRIFKAVAVTNLFERWPINRFNDPLGFEWKPGSVKEPTRVLSRAG